jgi:hypothetical protein
MNFNLPDRELYGKQIPLSIAKELKTFHAPKFGVKVSITACHMYGCKQPNYRTVNIGISESCIGKTCHRDDHDQAVEKVMVVVESTKDLIEEQ